MKKLIIILLIGLYSSLAVAAGNSIAGKSKALTCAACHGADGNSINPLWPKLASQHPHYLLIQMQAFKQAAKGGRNNPTMTPLMAALSTQDMRDLAAYYAGLSLKVGDADPKLVKRGEEIYRGGDFDKHITACIACHGPNGDGNQQAGFPKLSGQQAQYTQQQLVNFKHGARSNDLNHIMRDIARRMDDKDMAAVASYITGLH